MKPLPFWWIPIKLNSNPTSFYSTHLSASIPLQLFLESSLTVLLSFFAHVSSLKAKWFSCLKDLVGPLKGVFFSTLQSFSLARFLLCFNQMTFTSLETSLLIWKAYTKQSFVPSPAASRPPLFLFSFRMVPISPPCHFDSFRSDVLLVSSLSSNSLISYSS